MQVGRAGRWATREFDYQAWNGTFHFANWSAFAGEFRKEFMPSKAEDEAIGMLATDRYLQGKQTVSEYLDQFRDLVEDSCYTDPKTIVVKFRRGLDCRILTALTGKALGRPSDTDPEAWFCLAVQMNQDCATEDTFCRRVNIPSPTTLSHTSLPPQPAPPTPACYLCSDSPSSSLVQICTDAVSKDKAPRKRCAAHTVLCSPATALCSSPAFAEVSLVTAPTPAEEATEQVLNLTSTSDASQGAFAPPPIVPPSSAVCTPAEKELPAPTPAPADMVSHTPAPAEVVLPPTPASMDGVASDAIAPSYIPDSADVAASPAPLPALADEAIRAPAPVEAAYHTSTPADETPEPISDVYPDFGTAEHSVEECPSCSDIRYMHTNRLKKMLIARQLVAGDTPPAVPISQDRSFSLANPSAVRMVGPPLLLCSSWPSVAEFLVLDTREVREFAERLPTECQRLCQPKWARQLCPRKPGTPASN